MYKYHYSYAHALEGPVPTALEDEETGLYQAGRPEGSPSAYRLIVLFDEVGKLFEEFGSGGELIRFPPRALDSGHHHAHSALVLPHRRLVAHDHPDDLGIAHGLQ